MSSPSQPPKWSLAQIGDDVQKAVASFRSTRIAEPLEAYLTFFDDYIGAVEEFFELTVDLTELDKEALNVLSTPRLQEVARYLTGPPISLDDLKVLSDATGLNKGALAKNPKLAREVIGILRDGLDRRRFDWISQGREPTDAEKEAAIIATTALIATRKVETSRRMGGKAAQEAAVKEALIAVGFTAVATRKVTNLTLAPAPGTFCGEALYGPRKADFIIGLFDGRSMPLECKVSNSSTNSVKRLNNDAAQKAVVWRTEMGESNCVPAAVLGGVYKANNVLDAQSRGLSVFWSHDLEKLTNWVLATK